jgi:DNA ligase-1
MQFLEFSRICSSLEAISGRLEMIGLISGHLPSLENEELGIFVRFLMGRIFADWSPLKVGIGPSILYEAVAYVAGVSKSRIEDLVSMKGDVGFAVEELLATKEQTSFFIEPLNLTDIYHDFEVIASTGGSRSVREKSKVLRRLFANCQPLEGRYLSRLVLGELRIGIGEGNMREAIASAFDVPSLKVERANQTMNDLGEVASLASKGVEALENTGLELFRPVKMMLAQQGTITSMVTEHGTIAAEIKYDGSRFQFHKKGNECHIYSRKLEEVTPALPDVVDQLINATGHDLILDGEVVAIRDGKPLPFQFVLRRFRRKHDVSNHLGQIQLIPFVFDILYLDGETLIDLPLSRRREMLSTALDSFVAPQLVSDQEPAIEKFYHQAITEGQEGIMLKAPGSPYTPGVRGKFWVKIKPAVDTLDLAVIGAEWGEGKRAHYFGSFLLACQKNGELVPLSKVATGFSDEMLADIYELLKDTVIASSGKEVILEPTIVFEVGYAELQISPNYDAGYALRFPRFVRLREDKGVDEVETLSQITERYQRQPKSGSP